MTGRLTALFLGFLMAWLGLVASASAVTVDNLYAAQVDVEGTNREQLRAGYREGLKQVLLRVSGNRAVFEHEDLDALLRNAENLVQSFQVQRSPDGRGQQLYMTFGAVGVNRALANLDASVWGANRPATLVWVAVDSGQGRQLVTAVAPVQPGEAVTPEETTWQAALFGAAQSRGVPLLLPGVERAENRVLLSDIWGQFLEPVRQASDDYRYDTLAMIRVSQRGESWDALWRLEGMGFDLTGRVADAASVEAVAAEIVDTWADAMAARWAIAAGRVGETQQVDVVLEGVTDLASYARVQAALRDMAPVNDVGAVRVTGTQMTMRVAFSGEIGQLREHIALDERFVEQEAAQIGFLPPEESGFDALYQALQYQWRPSPVVDPADS
ncbi:MAG: DUF2066 domain-containing protein [Marinobacter sp.]|nr:DUF2066 domain-containing protein [Marinobacter sp.]